MNGFSKSQDPFNIFVILILLGLGAQFLYAGRRPFTGVTGSASKSPPTVPAETKESELDTTVKAPDHTEPVKSPAIEVPVDGPAPGEQPETATDQAPETVPAGQLPEDDQKAGRIGISIAMESPPSLLSAGLPETRETISPSPNNLKWDFPA